MIATAFQTGYTWSLRHFTELELIEIGSLDILSIFSLGLFVPGVVSTVSYGLILFFLKQVDARRSTFTKMLRGVRRILRNNSLFVRSALWIAVAVPIFVPLKFALEVSFVVVVSSWIIYLAVYAAEFRFSIREIFSASFYNFFRRKSVSTHRVVTSQLTWLGTTTLTISFIFGFYGLRTSIDSCIEIAFDQNNTTKSVAIIQSNEHEIVITDCSTEPKWLAGTLRPKFIEKIPSEKVFKIRQTHN